MRCWSTQAIDTLKFKCLENRIRHAVRACDVHWFRLILFGVCIQFKDIKDCNVFKVLISLVSKKDN